MILSDREIRALVDDGQIVIDPMPEEKFWTSTAVDLTLHPVLLKRAPQPSPTGLPSDQVRPAAPNFNIRSMMNDPRCMARVPIDPASGSVLEPGQFVLGFTREVIRFPTRSRIAARVEGKSSLARLGLGVHVTAPTLHSGFGARESDSPPLPIQLEIFNLGNWKIILDAGMPVCQLILEEVREMPQAGYRLPRPSRPSEPPRSGAPTPTSARPLSLWSRPRGAVRMGPSCAGPFCDPSSSTPHEHARRLLPLG